MATDEHQELFAEQLEAELLKEANAEEKISDNSKNERNLITELRKKARSARFYWHSKGSMEVLPAKTTPNQNITIRWKIPIEFVSEKSLRNECMKYAQLCKASSLPDEICLFRSRKRIDQSEGEIFFRSISNCNHIEVEELTNKIFACGKIYLKTPKGVGEYDFRYFSHRDEKETAFPKTEEIQDKIQIESTKLPICRSNSVSVEVQGASLIEAFGFLETRITTESNVANACAQFSNLISQIRSFTKPLSNSFKSQTEQQNFLLDRLFQLVFLAIKIVQKSKADVIENLEALQKDKKGKKAVTEFEELEIKRREIVSEGSEFSKVQFERWKTLKGHKMAYERKMSSLASAKSTLTSMLLWIVDKVLTCRALKNVDNLGRSTWKVSKKTIFKLLGILSFYCPISNKFYSNWEDLQEFYITKLKVLFNFTKNLSIFLDYKGFFSLVKRNEASFGLPVGLGARVPVLNLPRSIINVYEEKLCKELVDRVANLVPEPSFYTSRLQKLHELEIKINLKLKLLRRWSGHNEVLLVPFGSSINNYGSYRSDSDIVLMLIPTGLKDRFLTISGLPSADKESTKLRDMLWKFVLVNDIRANTTLSKVEIIEDLKDILEETEAFEIDDCRKKARVPILKFNLPLAAESEYLECDLCIDNRLALRNTLLLQTYSLVDERIKYMAQIIKLWAKVRDINSPVSRTLPSYAYILLLIFYLQNISPPILPVLQQIPFSAIKNLLNILETESLNFLNDDELERILYPLQNNDYSATSIESVMITGPDDKKYDTYFFGDPCYEMLAREIKDDDQVMANKSLPLLSRIASRNKQNIYQLLTGFFEFYAFQVDYGRVVVGVRLTSVVSTETKAAEESWRITNKMSIEDPFETSYDVAHMLSTQTHKKVRSEFLRAYAVLTNKALGEETKAEDIMKSNVVSKLLQKPQTSPKVEISSPKQTGILQPQTPQIKFPVRPPGF